MVESRARVGLPALATSAGVDGAAAMSKPAAIDIHHHYMPPFYMERALPWLEATTRVGEAIRNWTPARSLEELDAAGVETAVLSITAPAFAFDDGREVKSLARRCNEYAARLSAEYKGRFRFFTALPMPDLAASLDEVSYAYDSLGSSGVGLMTNYGGRYLGDPAFAPLFEALNRRRAIVHVHPTDVPCCRGLVADISTPTIEFPVDTGRTIASLLWSGTLSRFPDIRFIFSHGGGILPMVLSRVAAVGNRDPKLAERVPEGAMEALSRLFVDTATITNHPAFAATRSWVRPNHILYGSDYPFETPGQSLEALAGLDLPADLLNMVQRNNALSLLDSAR